jgi:hypothetical protein
MKLESRAVSIWFGFGYTTLICSGPLTSGTGGSFGFAAGSGAGVIGGDGTGIGPVTGGRGADRHDAPSSATQQQKPQLVNAFIGKFRVARALLCESFVIRMGSALV